MEFGGIEHVILWPGHFMNKFPRLIRSVVVVVIGLLMAVTSAAISGSGIHSQSAGSLNLQATVTPVVKSVSEIGSTDWITLVSVVIVLIILVPILILRKSWSK